MKKGGTTDTVSASHNVSKTFNGDGELTGSSNVFNPTPGSGTVTPVETSLENLDVRFDLPGYVLAPAEWIDIWVSVNVFGSSTVGTGSSNCDAQLAFVLDPGVMLDNDAGVETPWVGPPPAVPLLGLAGAAVLVGALVSVARPRFGR